MINEDPNMGRKQIFSELPLPSKVEEKGILTLIYKGVFIVVKLLLDIRLNLVKISEGKPIKTKHKEFQARSQKPASEKPVDNPVIKNTDEIKVEDVPSSKEKPENVTLGEEKKDDKPTKVPSVEDKPTHITTVEDEVKDQKDNVDPTIDL